MHAEIKNILLAEVTRPTGRALSDVSSTAGDLAKDAGKAVNGIALCSAPSRSRCGDAEGPLQWHDACLMLQVILRDCCATDCCKADGLVHNVIACMLQATCQFNHFPWSALCRGGEYLWQQRH